MMSLVSARWISTFAREAASAGAALQAALRSRPAADGGGAGAATASPAAGPAQDPVCARLLAAPDARLNGQPVMDADVLAAAIAYLAGTADAVRAVLAAAVRVDARAAPPGGGFSLAEHLWHLADIETLGWRPRMARILDEPRPRLAGVDGDRLAVQHGYARRPWRGAARRFVAERVRTLASLARFDVRVLQKPVLFAGLRAHAGGVLAAAVAHDLEHRLAIAERWAACGPGSETSVSTLRRPE